MAIDAKLVAKLRAATGAGMMECKNALAECDGDVETAKDYLRKRGVEVAEKKAGRSTNNGWMGQYVHHNGRVGVLIEVRCETDFVAKGDFFQTLLKDLCQQIAVTNPVAIEREEVSSELIEREKAIYREQVPAGKPPEIQEKIIEGKLNSFFKERCLLEQPFIKDSSLSVADMVKQLAGKIGENIQVRRFTRYTLGEGIEVKEEDFAAEVAAMTA